MSHESMPVGKEPHFISPRLLEALGGIKQKTEAGELVDKGAYLWGVEDREKGFGVFKHVLLVSRVAYALAKELQKKDPDRFGSLNMQSVVETAILHDISKLYAQDRESLPRDRKEAIGLRGDFKETDVETEEVGVEWLRDFGFPNEVLKGVKDHFPERIIDDPYWKIVLVSDFMAGQKIMSVQERIQDVKTRWIDQPVAEGKEPKIESAAFERARRTIEMVAHELFAILETTDEAFIQNQDLNNPENANRWEKFLMKTREHQSEERAKGHVRGIIG